jgi:membrane dipeptidase
LSLIVDAHEDIAWNVLSFGRDYSRSAAETRAREMGTEASRHIGPSLLGYPDWVRGGVAVVFATLHVTPARQATGGWETQTYADADEAHRKLRAQVDVYSRMFDEHPDQFRLIRTRADLHQVLSTWRGDPPEAPSLGMVMSMEGADAIRRPEELPEWYDLGLRMVGPAWAGTRYSGGTREPGPLTPDGRRLLEHMAELGMTLDLSHMSDEASLEALDRYPGVLMASHSNVRALLSGSPIPERHLSDLAIRRIAERDGVIGAVPYNRFLKGGWKPEDGREVIPLARLIQQIDYVCQLVGDAAHSGIGSDFDGGFGLDMVPLGLDTVADLQLIGDALAASGYNQTNVDAILGGNWLRLLGRALPES